MSYRYAAEKFGTARRLLMAPHPSGENDAFGRAFFECSLGFNNLAIDRMDEGPVLDMIKQLQQLMDTTGIEDSSGRGTWAVKIEAMSIDEKAKVSHLIDELAGWFDELSKEGGSVA